jgi:hypothetical protein
VRRRKNTSNNWIRERSQGIIPGVGPLRLSLRMPSKYFVRLTEKKQAISIPEYAIKIVYFQFAGKKPSLYLKNLFEE